VLLLCCCVALLLCCCVALLLCCYCHLLSLLLCCYCHLLSLLSLLFALFRFLLPMRLTKNCCLQEQNKTCKVPSGRKCCGNHKNCSDCFSQTNCAWCISDSMCKERAPVVDDVSASSSSTCSKWSDSSCCGLATTCPSCDLTNCTYCMSSRGKCQDKRSKCERKADKYCCSPSGNCKECITRGGEVVCGLKCSPQYVIVLGMKGFNNK